MTYWRVPMLIYYRSQIFGGRGLTRSGMGKHIEMFRRTQKFDAILGGAEEVLYDLGVRQACVLHPT